LKYPFYLFISFVFLSFQHAQAQAGPKGKITGQTVETTSQEIIPFSSIRLMGGEPSKVISGGIGNEKGQFSIEAPYGTYEIIIESVGFEAYKQANIRISKDQNSISLGKININTSSKTLAEVTVKGQKASMELALDKRIFNVGTDLANKGLPPRKFLAIYPRSKWMAKGPFVSEAAKTCASWWMENLPRWSASVEEDYLRYKET